MKGAKLVLPEERVTVTLTFKPEVEAGLLVKAHARGMELEEYLQVIVENEALPYSQHTPASEFTRRQTAVRRMLEFGDRNHLSLGAPVTRSMLHEGHRF